MAEEMQAHLDGLTARNVAAGMSPEEARFAARRAFGGVEQIKERARDERRWVWLEQFSQDVRITGRSLRRSPGFVVVAVLSLALGIGANTAIFSFINGVLLKPLPYRDAERLVILSEKSLPNGEPYQVSTLTAMDWIGASRSAGFDAMAAMAIGSVAWANGGETRALREAQASAGMLDILGVGVELGRAFLPEEFEPGKARVVVLSHSLWVAQFGGDREIIGRVIQLDGVAHTVIGVLQEAKTFDRRYAQLWRPLAVAPEKRTRNYHWLQVLGQLKVGVTLPAAHARMDAVAARIAHDFPETNKDTGVALEQFNPVGSRLRQSLFLMWGAVGVVLLIACANLANLSLTRGLARAREVAIRASLGAGRARLVRQFLTESLLLAGIGGAAGIAVGYAAMTALKRSVPMWFLPPEASVAMDGRVLLFAVGLTVVAGLAAGLVPAWQCSQTDPSGAIKEGGSGGGWSRHRVRNSFVVAQVALAFVLLAVAGLLLRSLARLGEVRVGDEPARIVVVPLPIAERWTADAGKFNAYVREMVERVGALPGVEAAALASAAPLQGTYGMQFQVDGRTIMDRAARPWVFLKTMTPDYFRAVGLKLRAGRGLAASDARGTTRVAVINEAMAQKYFPQENPLGKHLLTEEIALGKMGLGAEVAWEVVGVIENERIGALQWDFYPGLYVPSEQSPQVHQTLVVRTAMDPTLLLPVLRKAVYRMNPEQTLGELKTVEVMKADAMGANRLLSRLLGLFAGVALLLGALGIYGVLAYAVVQRTHELGVRAALGATPAGILGLILKSGMGLIVMGLVVGWGAALAVTRGLSALLFGVGERDPLTLGVAAGVIAGVGLAACLVPAWRAARVNPLVALRCE